MKNLLLLAIFAGMMWFGYGKFAALNQSVDHVGAAPLGAPTQASMVDSIQQVPSPFTCDGRTHCSHMTSCAEATYFIKNCPNTQMDGNNDGVPCERQWCR